MIPVLAFHLDLSNVRNIADIGSGAGFPSLPLKKTRFPHLQVTIGGFAEQADWFPPCGMYAIRLD